jgi:tRNA-dihydrouridine synthase
VASAHHGGEPDYALARELVERVEVPVIISGGLRTADAARRAYTESGAAAVMVARGSLGNPWIFEQLVGHRYGPPSRSETLVELRWVVDRAEEHLGPERAARYLRKFYPWYLERIGAERAFAKRFQRTESLEEARRLISALERAPEATLVA